MFTKQSTPRVYEAPVVCMHRISAESGFASSLGPNSIKLWVEEEEDPSLSF